MAASGKWIVTDHADPSVREGLEALGKAIDWLPDIGREELLSIIGDYEGMVISTRTAVDRELVDRAPGLRIVARLGSGMEHVDREYCSQKGIACLSSPEGNANAVGEHAFAMLLALSNRICRAQHSLRSGAWDREGHRGFELKGRTVGIIGYGHTGSAFAEKFAGWDTAVFAYDKYKSGYGSRTVKESSYDDILQCEIISFHVPLTDETRHWIRAEFIDACRPGVILVNTSRGAIADTRALVAGLESGKIGGLCIDVFEDEPLSAGKVHDERLYRRLLEFDNVVATPHIAGWTLESKRMLVEVLLSKVAQTLKKQGLL